MTSHVSADKGQRAIEEALDLMARADERARYVLESVRDYSDYKSAEEELREAYLDIHLSLLKVSNARYHLLMAVADEAVTDP